MSWQSGLLNDCEFVESVVEGQQVGQTAWFRPQGCTGLTLLNAYHCTAEALTAGTQYVFRVKTNCANTQSSSSWSVSSVPESTLATVQAWESNQRRLISINIASDLDYNEVIANADAFKSSIASQTAIAAGVGTSQVGVEIMAAEASAGRRLTATSVIFAVTIDGATAGESETSNHVMSGVASAVQATGSSSTLSVASTSTVAAAIAPEKITWSELTDGRLQLSWKPLPLGDCSFLAWHVLVNVAGLATPVSGCTNLMNLSHTSCVASGLDGSQSHSFTVAVLCADPAANSVPSEASDAWPSPSETGVPGVPCDSIARLSHKETVMYRRFSEELKLEVAPVLSDCADSSVQLKTRWEYAPDVTDDQFTSLDTVGLVDSSPLPNVLRIAAFSLLPGNHYFRALLENGATRVDVVTYMLTVIDHVPSFEITGPAAVGVGCGIQLNIMDTGPYHPNASVSYSWTCPQCANVSNFVNGTHRAKGLIIAADEAPVGIYSFRAEVTKTYGGSLTGLPSLSSHAEVPSCVFNMRHQMDPPSKSVEKSFLMISSQNLQYVMYVYVHIIAYLFNNLYISKICLSLSGHSQCGRRWTLTGGDHLSLETF